MSSQEVTQGLLNTDAAGGRSPGRTALSENGDKYDPPKPKKGTAAQSGYHAGCVVYHLSKLQRGTSFPQRKPDVDAGFIQTKDNHLRLWGGHRDSASLATRVRTMTRREYKALLELKRWIRLASRPRPGDVLKALRAFHMEQAEEQPNASGLARNFMLVVNPLFRGVVANSGTTPGGTTGPSRDSDERLHWESPGERCPRCDLQRVLGIGPPCPIHLPPKEL